MAREQYFVLFDTPIGVCGLAWSEHGLTRLQLPEADRRATERRLLATARGARAVAKPLDWVARVAGDVCAYAAGEKRDFAAVALDLAHVPAFHAQVYAAARGVGWGQTTTYGALARLVGEPGAARAVGQAMGRNPVPILIPCHRVLAAGGKSGGFSAHGGVASKARLLALEGVRLGLPRSPDDTQQAFAFGNQTRHRG